MNHRRFPFVGALFLSILFVAGAAAQTSIDTDSEAHSLLPGWFNRHPEQSSTTNQKDATTRPTSVPRVGSVNAPVELPGLGGAPLPKSDWTPAGSVSKHAVQKGPDGSSDNPITRGAATKQSMPNQQDEQARQSPPARPLPHLDPQQVRRELTGSFSRQETNGGTTPRIARGESANAESEDRYEGPLVPQTTDTTQEPASARAPLTLPSVEQSPWTAAKAANELPKAAPPLTTSRTTSTSQSPVTEPGSSAATSAPAAAGGFGRTTQPQTPPVAAAPQSPRSKEAFGDALQIAGGGDPNVLAANQMPIVTTDIRGPKQILVGRESTYHVRVQNQGSVAAQGVVVSVRVPAWADVIGTSATQGIVKPSSGSSSAGQLDWQLARLDGRATETLDLRLVPRESRPLELGVAWTVAPIGSRAVVEVQEPQLKIDVAGPGEVLFEKPQVFRLTLANPGTGPAENVKIELVPPGGGESTTHTIGDLAPGDNKTLEIELTAREPGKLSIKAIASAEGSLRADTVKEIFCRKPELKVEWRGPDSQYAGTTATYFFRVRNPGTAAAEDVIVKVNLPEGAEFAAASDGQLFDAKRREVTWRVGTLSPGDDHYMELKCAMKAAGNNQFHVAAATAAGDLTDSAAPETNVVALADLKLDVTDPSGPIAVGAQAVYEIHIKNRGASAARDVNVVGLFSDGIEPDQAEGAQFTIADGRIAFRTIDELPASRELTLKIRAHATKPGTHVFRAEVLCRDADIKLATEETTRFYADQGAPETSAGTR